MKKFVAAVLTVIMVVSWSISSFASQYLMGPGVNNVPENVLMNQVSLSMMQASFWNTFPGCDKLVMSPEEIKKFNETNMSNPDCYMNNLYELPETFNGVKLRNNLAGFSNPAKLYLNGSPVPASFYQSIRNNIANANVAELMNTAYGFCIERSELRSIPCSEWLADDTTDPEWDDTVISAVLIGEPLTAYFTTADGQFTYVKTEICDGWMPTADLVLCHSKAEWEDTRHPENILVVTGPEVTTELSYNQNHSQRILDMGTVLELSNEPVQMVDNRMSWYNYVVYMPGRGADGLFVKEKMLIPVSSDVSVGYLKYTKRNIIDLAFKSLGKRYGWGGGLDAQDCSSFAREVYLCFGLCLPRNTTWQRQMNASIVNLSGMDSRDKANALNAADPGSIVQFSGHEMIYLGEYKGKHYTINDVSSLAEDTEAGLTKRRVRDVIINSLEDTKRPNGKIWFDELNAIITVK